MGMIYGTGINQRDLADLLGLLKTNFNGVLAKLDAENLTDSDYAELHAVALPAGIKTTGDRAIRDQGLVVSFLDDLVKAFNAVLAKLDGDDTVGDTDYASELAITNTVGTKHLKAGGMDQGSLVNLLDAVVINLNLLNAKLDADSGTAGEDYASLWNVTDTVDAARTAA